MDWILSECTVYTLHYQKYVDTCLSKISLQNHGHQYGVGPPFAAITASTLLGRCWNIAAGTWFHSATQALVRSGTDVGRLGLASSRRFNSFQRCSMVLRSGLCAGQSRSSTPILTNHFCMDLVFSPLTVATMLEAQNCLECPCMLCVKISLH